MEYNELNSNKQEPELLDEDFFKDKNFLEDDIYEEPERLKIEKIEKLESLSKNYKKLAIIYGSLVGMWALCALINFSRILTENDPSFSLQLAFFLDIICSGLNAMLSHSNYNSMKETNNEIDKIKEKTI